MADDQLDEHDELLKERLLTSEFALLNTLAGIAGLFVGAATLLAALSPKVPRGYFLAIIILCSVVLFCVLLDFRLYRRSYESMAFTPKAVRNDLSAYEAYSKKLSLMKTQARLGRRWKRRRERLSYACLAIVVVLFIVIVYRY